MFICDLEKDSLANVLRRIGLTGTKVGCNKGVCGSCSVILNGKLVRSCTKKIKDVQEYSKILTIEGLGIPNSMHPLQQAWVTHGAAQCGFCAPGFIVSAYALLRENAVPSREEVRGWFKKNRNICRCTGYKPIVDAVMAAAKVMRGEARMEDITFKHPENGEYYGSRLPRPTAIAKVCGVMDYGDDIKLKMPPGTLHIAVIMPKKYHHASILGIDFSVAEKMPGVVKVITAKDISGTNRINASMLHPRRKVFDPIRPILNDRKIFRYGDVVGLVAAITEEQARAAATAVKVELEPLPEYLNILDAVAPNAVQIHEGIPNIYLDIPVYKGQEDTRDVLENSALVVEGSFHSTREPHLPIEGDMVQAYWDSNGNLTVHGKGQAIYGIRLMTAKGIGIDLEKLRIIANPTGGSFGFTTSPSTYALGAVAAMVTGGPISLSLSYEEFMLYSGKRSASYANCRLGCDANGRLTAVEYEAGLDHGAYVENADFKLARLARFITWPYYVPNGRVLAKAAFSNHNYGVSYRGFGMPQASTTSESMIDMLAVEAGIDPFEFRYINIARPGETNINSFPYKDYRVEKLMDVMRPIYEEAKQRVAREDRPELRRGVGISIGGYVCTTGPLDKAEVDLQINPDGSFTCFNTWEDMGQGGDIGTVTCMLEALKEIKLTPDKVNFVASDSFLCPDSGIAAASRSHIMNGNAIIDAAGQLLSAMRKDGGSYRTYGEMVAEGIPTRYRGKTTCSNLGLSELDPNTGIGDPTGFYMYSVNLAEVEVETVTGKAKVVKYVCVDDNGVIGNELSVDGQAYGGLSHSIGFALSEIYEDVHKHTNIAAAGIPTIDDIPDDFVIIHNGYSRDHGPFGSAGCSENYQSSGHVAVLNAIYNATGVRIYELPATPAKIKSGMELLASGRKVEPPARYYLGGDMYEQLEDIAANPI
jgi:aldehyde oxidoreductase